MSALSILSEECELLNDSKYRSYITQIEKALKSFDSTSEWADLISALGKLNKVLLGHVKYPVIPKRVTIGKRLAQCLHPALPSGVHLKALETYDIIFKCIGTHRLAQDLFIYSAGLFPLLSHAAMNVKPVLLMIYERHFVSLGKRIKPGLNGLLLGLLPGLEEGSEFFDQTNNLLEDFCEATEPAYFYTCLWECVHSCPSVRLPAVTYLTTHYNKKQTMEDQLYMIGLNINLMVESICHAVQDTSVLVQRSLLDFLTMAFPLHNSQLTHSDMARIVKASINIVLRRDMSLNRRFYAWLLGPGTHVLSHSHLGESKSKGDKSADHETELTYFEKYSKDLLVQALKQKLTEKPDVCDKDTKQAVLKPFRILISLLDKPEIGPVILEHVLLSVFRCLYREFEHSKVLKIPVEGHKKSSSNTLSAYDELLKTANLLFGTFEPYFIWDFTARIFNESCLSGSKSPGCLSRLSSRLSRQGSSQELPDTASVVELCQLVTFLLDVLSLETFIETQTEHLPRLLCCVITSLTEHCDILTDSEIIMSLKLCTKLLSKVQPTMTTHHEHLPQKLEPSARTSISEPEVETLSQDDVIKMNKEMMETGIGSVTVNTTDPSTRNSSDTVSASSSNSDRTNDTEVEPVKEQNKETKNNVPELTDPEKNLMQTCVHSFQNFFHTLVTHKFVEDENLIQKCVYLLVTKSNEFITPVVETDLTEDTNSEENGGINGRVDKKLDDFKISLGYVDEKCQEMFTNACQLMVEFASFPVYCIDSRRQSANQNQDLLPVWLRDLVISACFVDNFTLQSSSISTMLDLIILAQSVQVENKSTNINPGNQSTNSRPRSLVILPTLHPENLRFLNEETEFYKVVAKILWHYMDESTASCHQQAVKLFNILHQVAPSSWICEDVIGSGLVAGEEIERIRSLKKFMVLWHLTRHKATGVIPGKPLRTFDRSMFVVLDCLKEESSPVKALATTWLTHVIQHGDVSRVMEPLLLMLLHPDTARVSIQHVNIHKPRKVQLSESSEDDAEANIYAISSEGGNIIYHVSMEKGAPKKHSQEELKSYALTVLNDRGASTAPVRTRSEQELHFERVNPSDLKLRVNPFGSESSLDKLIFDGYDFPQSQPQYILNKAKRLDRQTCAEEGISFSGTHSHGSQEEVTEDEQKVDNCSQSDSNVKEGDLETVGEIVQNILDDILSSVTHTAEETNTTEVTEIVNDKQIKDSEARKPVKLTERSESINSSVLGEHELLNSVSRLGCHIDSPTASELELSVGQVKHEPMDDRTNIHALHMHLLLYTQKYDYYRTLYAFSILKSMLGVCPRLLVSSLVTTSISSLRTPQLAKLQLLLARHRKSVFGKNFFGEIPPEVLANFRSSMFIEILISVCLYFIRGYYPNLMMSKMSQHELLGNKQVHIMATEALTLMISEVIVIMRDSGKNFVSYISDLLSRCKVQKTLLHCILATIFNSRKKKERDLTSSKITEAIIAFNEENLDLTANETFQIRLVTLLLAMIRLEDQISRVHGNTEPAQQSEWDRLRVSYQPSLQNVRYIQGHLIIQQGMFMSSVLSSLKQFHLCHMHRHSIALITGALPYMSKHLPGIVISVVSQICRNLEAVASQYESSGGKSTALLEKVPPDYTVTLLDSLTHLCHYCLLDVVSPVSIGQPSPSSPSNDTAEPTNIFTNLWHVFNPVGGNRETSPARDLGAVSPVLDARNNLLSVLPRIIACMTALWRAMKIADKHEESPALVMGAPKIVRQYILEFLSPVSLPHGPHLLGAIAVAWNDRRSKSAAKNMKKVVPLPCEDQLLLVDLISAVKVLPMDTLVQTVKQVIKQPPLSELSRAKKNVSLEVNMLQFFYAYVQKTSQSQLTDSWPALLSLLKEALQLNLVPQGQFLLLVILNEFVQKTPAMADKKNQKEIQEISQRLLEAISTIAGSSLEQTTWLRKNYAVKPGPQAEEAEHDDSHADDEVGNKVEKRVSEPEPTLKTQTVDSKYSVQALNLLAEVTAPLLDVIYSSEEKDKVAPFLVTLLYNIFPYLKHHSANNLPSLRASSQFLSSISSYQYTRKAWRKEALDILLDPSFFQMDSTCIGYWHSVVDNLMTHDKTTYKELMSRVSIAQTASLNIFSNREQEIDQKAAMLKRLAFTIFCSESDQYQKSIPEIQERLSESLRVPQAPSVMAHVFLCFRVLILRISPQHLTSMWPTIITELIHVFLQIEQELSTETDEFIAALPSSSRTQIQRIAALDSSWAHLGNGLNAHNNPSWLQLYLSACKLLDLCLALPADRVPQFQLYRWAFIGGAAAGEVEEELDIPKEEQKLRSRSQQISFKPHIIRLAKLLNTKLLGDVPVLKLMPGRPLLTLSHLRSLNELQPFFNTLCLANQTDNFLMAAQQLGGNTSENQSKALANGDHGTEGSDQSESRSHGGKKMPKSKSVPSFDMLSIPQVDLGMGLQTKSTRQYIEELLERDFLEPMA